MPTLSPHLTTITIVKLPAWIRLHQRDPLGEIASQLKAKGAISLYGPEGWVTMTVSERGVPVVFPSVETIMEADEIKVCSSENDQGVIMSPFEFSRLYDYDISLEGWRPGQNEEPLEPYVF